MAFQQKYGRKISIFLENFLQRAPGYFDPNILLEIRRNDKRHVSSNFVFAFLT